MKLSIIVPVHNMAADGKLEYCLDSLVAQTIRDYEIIAVDDASTDSSLEILRAYEKRYPDKFVVIALEENHRQGGAKNAALEICRGEYVGFVDSDDWLLPEAYETLVRMAEEQDADIAGCDLCLVNDHVMEPSERIPSLSEENAGELTAEKKGKLLLGFGALVTMVYERHIFMEPKLRFPEHIFYEDNAIAAEIIMRANKIAYLPKPMYFYYQHGNSTVHVISEERCRDRMEAMRTMIRLAKENGYYETYREQLEWHFAELFYRNTLFSYLQGVKKGKLSFIRELGREMKKTFPGFLENALFLNRIDQEERKMMSLQQRSTLLFYLTYRALWTYRSMRNKA